MAGEKPPGIAVRREQRLDFLPERPVLATLVRQKGCPLGFRPCKRRVEEGEDVFPTV
jgi:hypothetical protein